jgi:uncharacterized membrane protein
MFIHECHKLKCSTEVFFGHVSNICAQCQKHYLHGMAYAYEMQYVVASITMFIGSQSYTFKLTDELHSSKIRQARLTHILNLLA